MTYNTMTKKQLEAAYRTTRDYIKLYDDLANNMLNAGRFEELDKIEAILDELNKREAAILQPLQHMQLLEKYGANALA